MIIDSSTHGYSEIFVNTDKFCYYGILNIVDDDAYISHVYDFEVYKAPNRQKFNRIGRIVINLNSNKNISVYVDTKYDKYEEVYEDLKQVMSELTDISAEPSQDSPNEMTEDTQ